ncbi:MAG: hypothetical protein ACI4V7_10435 [Succinivibrionaceae bacterium]
MSDKTIVNSFSSKLKTVINNNVNQNVPNLLGQVVLNEYTVNDKLPGNSGEADIYLATENKTSKQVVIKLYRRKNAIKDEVLKKLRSIDNKHIAKILAYDSIDEYPFIVMPYYKNGSLDNLINNGVRFTLDELKTLIIPSINEA